MGRPKRKKRLLSFALVLFLLVSVPVNAYASIAGAATCSAGGYVLNLILSACGIDFSLSSVTAILGEWSGYEEYLEKGRNGQLGTFSQYLYDNAYGDKAGQLTEARRQEFENLTHILDNVAGASWGAVVTGAKSLILAVKDWLESLTGYGSETLIYSAPSPITAPLEGWDEEDYCSSDIFPFPEFPGYSYPYQVIHDPANEYWFTSRRFMPRMGCYEILNWYHTIGDDVFGLWNEETGSVSFYRKASGGGYEEVKAFYVYAYVNADGSFKYSVSDSDYGRLGAVSCSRRYLGNLPFQVFLSLEDMERYCRDGTVGDTVKTGEVILKALSINTDVQNSVLTDIPDTITLPDSAEAALKNAGAISDAMGDTAALKSALGSAGLLIDWKAPAIPDTPGITDTDTKELIAKVTAIPKEVVDTLFSRMETNGQEVTERFSIPKIIMSKFPFCIPFDLIYLLKILCKKAETIRIVIPIRIHYESYHYEHDLVVDFSDYQVLVDTLRVMLDLLFCACLIAGTRELIRG